MTIDNGYALKKDIRNNTVVREVDTRQEREIGRTIWLACAVVALLLFSAWQHYQMVQFGYDIERDRLARAEEEIVNRKLRLSLEALQTPQQIERRATRQLGLVPAGPESTIILERAVAAPPSGVVARAR